MNRNDVRCGVEEDVLPGRFGHGWEAQFFDHVDVRIGRSFHGRMDPTRPPREMAIAWAEEERKAIERDTL